MAQNSYQKLILVEDLVLTWPSSFNGGPVITDINDIEVIGTPRTLTLPAANLVSAGQNFIINNIDGPDFDLLYNDGSTVLSTIPEGEAFQFYLIDASTANGEWRKITPLGGFNGIVSLTAQSTYSSITITGSPVTPPNGIINFKLPESITNLNKLNATDFLIVATTNPLTFKTVELLGGENITITEGNGLGSDPVIDLNTTITSINSLTVGEMTFSGNLITNDVTNGNIQLVTNGTGNIQMNGVNIDVDGNISGINNFIGASAFFFFTDTIVGMSNQIVLRDQVNISSVTGSAGTYIGHFSSPMPNLNYAVFISLGSTGGSLPFISNAYVIVRELTSVTIIVTDASGELVLSAPHGVSVMVMSA
jgi:hypothetical protein